MNSAEKEELSLWKESPQWRWLVVGAFGFLVLAWLGYSAGPASSFVAPGRAASFDATKASLPPAGVRGSSLPPVSGASPAPTAATNSTAATLPDAFNALQPSTKSQANAVVAPGAQRAGDALPNVAGQAYSNVVWQNAGNGMSGSISGGGLIAAYCCAGAFSRVLANRGVSSGRHYLELTISVRPGADESDTWTSAGVTVLDSGAAGTSGGSSMSEILGSRGKRYRNGDVLMFAIDVTQQTVFSGVNGQWLNGTPGAQGGQQMSLKPGQQLIPYVNISASSKKATPEGDRWIANFGSAAFKYGLPGGFNSYGSSVGSSSAATPDTKRPVALPPSVASLLPKDSLMGKTFRDSVTLQGEAIPLPEGLWSTLAHFRGAPGSTNGDALLLGRIKGTQLEGLIAINAYSHDQGVETGFPAFKSCERDDYLALHPDTNNAQGTQRCWWVNHAVGIWSEQSLFRAGASELANRGVSAPPVMINVGFRKASKRAFATAFYYFDPASQNISSMPGSWAGSEWHRSRLSADPARASYIKRLDQWGENWAPLFFAAR